MVNPDFELERLRTSLRSRGFPEQEINQICMQASRSISNAISDALADAVIEAAQAGEQVQASDFISELRTVAFDNDFYISTDSGNLDFSEPPFPMMQSLLKNPKVAKDGSLYKVIPIGNKSPGDKRFSSLADVQVGINNARNTAKASVSTSIKDISHGPMTFSGAFAAQKSSLRDSTMRKNIVSKNTGSPAYRTVSSKQDPAKNWVRPSKEKDMTLAVADINSRLRDTIDNLIVSIVQQYEEGV